MQADPQHKTQAKLDKASITSRGMRPSKSQFPGPQHTALQIWATKGKSNLLSSNTWEERLTKWLDNNDNAGKKHTIMTMTTMTTMTMTIMTMTMTTTGSMHRAWHKGMQDKFANARCNDRKLVLTRRRSQCPVLPRWVSCHNPNLTKTLQHLLTAATILWPQDSSTWSWCYHGIKKWNNNKQSM